MLTENRFIIQHDKRQGIKCVASQISMNKTNGQNGKDHTRDRTKRRSPKILCEGIPFPQIISGQGGIVIQYRNHNMPVQK